MVNTTKSISGDPPRGTREPIGVGTAAEAHTVNTSAILEEDLVYEDEEPEVLTAVSASGWYASFSGGRHVPVVLWSVWDDGSVTGAVVGENGRINASSSVESMPQFEKYTYNDSKENQ